MQSSLVALSGFEPENMAPKTTVLPLHYRAVLKEEGGVKGQAETIYLEAGILLFLSTPPSI